MISQGYAAAGALLPLAGSGWYILDMRRGRAVPDRVSWTLWAAAPLIAFAAEAAEHASLGALLVTFTLGAGPAAVLLASLASREAYWKLTWLDAACGAASVLALELWAVTRQGNVAIAFAVLADALAAIPTIRKSQSHPESESPWTYLASGTGAILTLLTISRWTFAACAFPVYAAGVCTLIAALILVPRLTSLPAGRRAALLRRGAWAAGAAGCLALIAVSGLGVSGTLSARAVPAGAAPAPAGAAMTRARPAHVTAAPRRPGAPRHHHRHRRHQHAPGAHEG